MNTILVLPGMIYINQDPAAINGTRSSAFRHPYIILGCKPVYGRTDTGKKILVQAMGITSLTGKAADKEIPIQMSNSTVGYITPWNIYSFDMNELNAHNFKGIISGNESERSEFIKFLLKLYSLHLGLLDIAEAQQVSVKYSEYITKFWNENRYPEFRDVKGVIKTVNDEVINKLEDTRSKEFITVTKQSASTAITEECATIAPEPKINHKNLADNNSASNLKGYEISNVPIISINGDVPVVNIDKIERLNTAGYKIAQWSNEDLLNLIYGSLQYKYEVIQNNCLRWSTEDSYLKSLRVVYATALKKGIIQDSVEVFACKDLNERSSNEIRQYLSFINKNLNTKKDKCLLLSFAQGKKALNTYLAKCRMELNSRNKKK